MTADEFNSLFPVGTAVVAYPGPRPGVFSGVPFRALETVTRTPAWSLGHGTAVVAVEGHTAGIALTHVDVIGGAA